jgi:hypothetical protein
VFENVKAAIAKETVLAYPDFLKPFEVYTAVDRLYSIQYKGIFGAPDKVRHYMCDEARPLSQV